LLTTQANVFVYISDEFDGELKKDVLDGEYDNDTVNAEVEDKQIAPVAGKYSIPVTSGDSSYDIVVAEAYVANCKAALDAALAM
jgi:hypothetical protein